MRTILAVALVISLGSLALSADYPRKELLVQVGDVAGLLKGGGPVLLDVRQKAAYEKEHIPNAAWVDAASWAKEFKDGSDATGWATRIGGLGITPDRTVLLYDEDQHRAAARVWWILRYWGVKDVRIINGGWKAHLAAGLPVQKEAVVPMPAPKADLKAEAERLATKEQVKAAIKGGTWQLVDARSTDEFCGKTETATRNGAMPGALHLEWSEAVDKNTGKFKSADELTALFKKAGIDPKRPTATYCQSGGRAAMMAFTLELMGGEKVRNYHKSWAEWGNADDTPVVAPDKK
jgi:thiosulfate/3-mercaptopyruvate sulfurtransferase